MTDAAEMLGDSQHRVYVPGRGHCTNKNMAQNISPSDTREGEFLVTVQGSRACPIPGLRSRPLIGCITGR
jgi:hypothetical protein